MNKIVITGGAGFIGSHLADACCQLPQKPEVIVLDNLRTGRRANLDRNQHHLNFSWIEGSICDAELVEQVCTGADWIFHLAAMISVPESLIRPLECVDLNVRGTINVLEAARKHRVKKVVLSSSAAIYGDEPELPKHELMRPAPQTPYGITKLDGEYYLEMYRKNYGISTVSLRYFNVYGPHQDPNSQYAAAVPAFIQRAITGQPIQIFGDGQQTRDFVYVGDVAAANLWVASHSDLHGIYNVATGTTVTILQLAESIRGLLNSSSPIQHQEPRPGDIRASWSDPGKLMATGFKPSYDLTSGLRPTLAAARQD